MRADTEAHTQPRVWEHIQRHTRHTPTPAQTQAHTQASAVTIARTQASAVTTFHLAGHKARQSQERCRGIGASSCCGRSCSKASRGGCCGRGYTQTGGGSCRRSAGSSRGPSSKRRKKGSARAACGAGKSQLAVDSQSCCQFWLLILCTSILAVDSVCVCVSNTVSCNSHILG